VIDFHFFNRYKVTGRKEMPFHFLLIIFSRTFVIFVINRIVKIFWGMY